MSEEIAKLVTWLRGEAQFWRIANPAAKRGEALDPVKCEERADKIDEAGDALNSLKAELQKRVSKEAAQEASDAFKELLAEAERNRRASRIEYYEKWLEYFQERS